MSRHYEVMVILEPSQDERTVPQTLEGFLKVIRNDGGTVENVDVWGRRRLAYEIKKHGEGVYAVVDVNSESDAVKELERQLSLQEIVLRTKVVRRDNQRNRGSQSAASA